MSADRRTDWRTTARTSLRVVGLLVLVVAVAPFVLYAVPAAAGAQGSYVVLSGSMEPTIGTGDVVFVYAADPHSLQVGDVITFNRDGTRTPITHRVIDIEQWDGDPSGLAFQTMGDANEDADASLVPGSAVIGVVPQATLPVLGETALRAPKMGYVIQFTNTDLGFVLLVGVPLGLLVLNEVWSIVSSPETITRTRSDDESASETADERAVTDGADASTGSALVLDDLTLTLAVLGVASAYAVWVAYAVFTPWSVSAAVLGLGTFLYLGALRYRALQPRGGDVDAAGDAPETDAVEEVAR